MPVALAQSGYCPEGCESRGGQAEEGEEWVTIPSAAFALFPIEGSLSGGHSSLVQAQELVPGFRTPCFLGFFWDAFSIAAFLSFGLSPDEAFWKPLY